VKNQLSPRDRRRRARARIALAVHIRGGIGTLESFDDFGKSLDVSRDGVLIKTARGGYWSGQLLQVTCPYSEAHSAINSSRQARVIRSLLLSNFSYGLAVEFTRRWDEPSLELLAPRPYSRELVNLEENYPVQEGNLTFGTGVTLGQTTSVRDSLLQARLDQENQTASQLSAFLGPMNQVQSLFNETSGSGLQAPLTAFFDSFTQLAANPSDSSLRESVITAGQNLASAIQQDASNLQSLQANTDLGVQQSVTQINTLTSEIASLNTQISGLVGAGQVASTFLDQRDQLVSQLSGLIGISETPAGNESLTLSTANGSSLVVGGESFALSTQENGQGFHDVYANGADITSAITGGTLGGDIQVRDQAIPAILDQLNTLAYGLTSAVNTQSEAGFDANGNPGVAFFTPLASATGAASSIQVAIPDPNLVAASSDGTVGSNGNANALANLQNQNIVDGQTPANYYGSLVFQIGNEVSQANAEQTSVGLVQQQLQNQQGSESGVSLDEEAVNLIRYQSAYEASANVVSVVNQLFYTLINMDVITT
jgi:flagellar hook-associated protein 1